MELIARSIRPAVFGFLGSVLAVTPLAANAFQEEGKLVYGSDMTFFPYEYQVDNKPVGFDVEFINGVAKAIGREAVGLDTRWANLIPGLRGGRFDIVNSAMYITADRVKVIDMIPYLKTGQAILAPVGSDYQPKVPEDFCGHKIGSMAGTSFLQNLQKLNEEYCIAEGLQPISISEYSTDPETTQAMLAGAVEAQITDAAVAKGVIDKLGNRVAITSETMVYPVLNGFAVRKGNDEVKAELIKGIELFKQTPEYTALLEKYSFEAPTAEDIEQLMPKP